MKITEIFFENFWDIRNFRRKFLNIAIIADIHSNLEALKAVLAEIKT